MATPRIAQRYAAFIDRHRWPVLVLSWVLAAASIWLASKLPLRTDFSDLLPPDSESVIELRALQKRARAFGTLFVVVESSEPEVRSAATRKLYDRLIDPVAAGHGELVDSIGHVAFDDSVQSDFLWNNRFLFVDLADLKDARKALAETIKQAKLEANPLYIDLDDDDDGEDGDLETRVAELRERLDRAEAARDHGDGYVSRDKTLQMLIVRSTAPASDIKKSKRMVEGVRQLADDVASDYPAGAVTIGLTGNVQTTLAENRAVLRGMVLAAVVTVLLCAIGLFWYFRSFLSVMASLWSLAVGVLATFAVTKLAIGHLNLVSAFLTAIVVGNGINAGLLLLARYQEELREKSDDLSALAAAIAGAARGTLAASLAAGAAYGSLVITEFRGFRDFGIIGGIGMVLCWVSAFTVLPAGLAVLSRRGWLRPRRPPALGRALAVLLTQNTTKMLLGCAAVSVVAGVLTWRYIDGNPMEENWEKLRSDSDETGESQRWYQAVHYRFERDFRKGVAGAFAIGLSDRDQVRGVVAMLREHDRGKADEDKLLDAVRSLDDLVPREQDAKIAVLADINELLDDDALAALDDGDRELALRLLPPANIPRIAEDDVPEELAWPFIEKDGSKGRIVIATSAPHFKTWVVADRVAFAEGVRALPLPDDSLVGGQAFVIADIVSAMESDGPRASLAALIGAVLVVWLIVGLGRHAFVTLLSGTAGVVGMIALAYLFSIKVNFLDFIAFPITIGIGIDYAVNIAARERQQPGMATTELLSTTGAAVVLCSYTTIVGYGSLLLSDNAGIRSFGHAAILGEFACIGFAVTLVPALLARWHRHTAATGGNS